MLLEIFLLMRPGDMTVRKEGRLVEVHWEGNLVLKRLLELPGAAWLLLGMLK